MFPDSRLFGYGLQFSATVGHSFKETEMVSLDRFRELAHTLQVLVAKYSRFLPTRIITTISSLKMMKVVLFFNIWPSDLLRVRSAISSLPSRWSVDSAVPHFFFESLLVLNYSSSVLLFRRSFAFGMFGFVSRITGRLMNHSPVGVLGPYRNAIRGFLAGLVAIKIDGSKLMPWFLRAN